MKDLYHYFGQDIAASATGDLLPVDSTVRGQQRILRRLLTNPREVLSDGTVLPPDNIFHPEYGAGLARKVGTVIDLAKLRVLIRGQMLLEDAVARTPEPVIDVQEIPGGMTFNIQYNDAVTKTAQILSFNVSK